MKYEFLVCDGAGAASRGFDNDTFYCLSTEADSLDQAVKNVFEEIVGCPVEDCLDDPDSDEEYENFDALDYIDGLDITGGDPWIEGIKENGRKIREENIENMEEYPFEISYDDSMEWFGYDILEDSRDDEEEAEEITLEDCIEQCNGNKEAGKIIYDWLRNEDALFDDREDVFSGANMLDLVDACTDKRERDIVCKALGIEIYDESYVDESSMNVLSEDVKEKISGLGKLTDEIKELEKLIKDIEVDTRKYSSYGSNTRSLSDFFSKEDLERLEYLKNEIKRLEKEALDLEAKYQHQEVVGQEREEDDDRYYYHDVYQTFVHDEKAKTELEPKVTAMRAQAKAFEKELEELKNKAINAYNSDAEIRRTAGDIPGKKDRLAALKQNKKQQLEDLVKEEGFDNVIDYIDSEVIHKGDSIELVNSGIDEDGHIYVICDLNFKDVDFDEDAFDDIEDGEWNFLDEEKFLENYIERDVFDYIGGEYEASDFEYNFEVEYEDSDIRSDAKMYYKYYPGTMYRSNGDPGDPPDWDTELEGSIDITCTIRITKLD